MVLRGPFENRAVWDFFDKMNSGAILISFLEDLRVCHILNSFSRNTELAEPTSGNIFAVSKLDIRGKSEELPCDLA